MRGEIQGKRHGRLVRHFTDSPTDSAYKSDTEASLGDMDGCEQTDQKKSHRNEHGTATMLNSCSKNKNRGDAADIFDILMFFERQGGLTRRQRAPQSDYRHQDNNVE